VISEEKNDKTILPVLNGLVLAGGHSKRMGQDKSVIKWHGKEQRYYMADLLQLVCHEVYISCRGEQQDTIGVGYPALVDTVSGAGPLGGIQSAFKKHNDTAWLVVACDLPLLDLKTLCYLKDNRDAACIATTFESPFDHLPEPLITIWEPSAWPVLFAFLEGGYSCPRKALLRNMEQVKVLAAPDPRALMNTNTPGDAEKAFGILGIDISHQL
jgi:molybdopterin-guanine dinucleotide biosynthesis protein A